ncbi:Histidine kinase-, DNA gyrase B-, and HSP90-like ATPase [Ruminococcaceae bacterium KH2T8]|nr:Histidine kinase-, DNA gyrase B-, and HSP90-like ATPase [Ruminococcaceae bacterium KH2T8]
MRSIDLPPYAPILMESTRAIGYSLEAAIADVVDNSIAASAHNIFINFFPVDEEYVYILDDGCGMDSSEITRAMQYGSKNPNDVRNINDLGRFGLGLKTASLSQCRLLTVVSKRGEEIVCRQWDLDYVNTMESWALKVLDENEINDLPGLHALMQLSSGTLVVWQKLDRMRLGELDFESAMGKKMDDVRAHLSLVYHRYLSNELGNQRIKISLNNLQLLPDDPFMEKKSEIPMDDETMIIGQSRVIVRTYILPHPSKLEKVEIDQLGGKEGIRRHQGFYVYRNKRLLVWGTWFHMMRQAELSKLVRIRVDIPNDLDDLWTLDIKKSTAIPPEIVRKNLKALIERMSEKSKRTWTFRGKKEVDDRVEHVWNRLKTNSGGYLYEINRKHSIIDSFVNRYPETKNYLYAILKQIEGTIPLNALYVDLSVDEKIDNETMNSIKEVNEIMRSVMKVTDPNLRQGVFESMIESEPFVQYEDILREEYERGGFND